MKTSQPILFSTVCTQVPYERVHVPKYHEWMSIPALLEATASEPLSLEQEYHNQISWKEDLSKYTYIILDNSLCDALITSERTQLEASLISEPERYIDAMAGDVNLFLHDYLENEGELEVMIANEASRSKGLAQHSLRLLMKFAREKLNLNSFVVKISKNNQASLQLFQKRLHFEIREYVDVFEEYELVSTAETLKLL
jgi:RimJ/RimL family protein N-acetyltransferase